MANTKMTVEYVEFDKEVFSHLSNDELNEIQNAVNNKTSLCFKFYDDKNSFHVIIDVDAESVHVRRISGQFIFRWNYIYKLCCIIAKKLGLNKITVIADKNFMVFAVKKLGFYKVKNDYYERIIT